MKIFVNLPENRSTMNNPTETCIIWADSTKTPRYVDSHSNRPRLLRLQIHQSSAQQFSIRKYRNIISFLMCKSIFLFRYLPDKSYQNFYKSKLKSNIFRIHWIISKYNKYITNSFSISITCHNDDKILRHTLIHSTSYCPI